MLCGGRCRRKKADADRGTGVLCAAARENRERPSPASAANRRCAQQSSPRHLIRPDGEPPGRPSVLRANLSTPAGGTWAFCGQEPSGRCVRHAAGAHHRFRRTCAGVSMTLRSKFLRIPETYSNAILDIYPSRILRRTARSATHPCSLMTEGGGVRQHDFQSTGLRTETPSCPQSLVRFSRHLPWLNRWRETPHKAGRSAESSP